MGTPNSRCDYIVYTMREKVGDEVVAVLIGAPPKLEECEAFLKGTLCR